ncbi:hypothetical protein GC105_01525 [Alkalibaculum sp. M08DMB]|uniref:Uncharacterized protein n=1 Tax=Alkalibaculum sporogenes TaxID=2655001 RepID=A0A6A7K5Q0_9FIRM|nr:hypothetical protein [Alkalibaculum sporogenes]MPW24473.1 hypothetical protein [Alkalibaculum sporogenes]
MNYELKTMVLIEMRDLYLCQRRGRNRSLKFIKSISYREKSGVKDTETNFWFEIINREDI